MSSSSPSRQLTNTHFHNVENPHMATTSPQMSATQLSEHIDEMERLLKMESIHEQDALRFQSEVLTDEVPMLDHQSVESPRLQQPGQDAFLNFMQHLEGYTSSNEDEEPEINPSSGTTSVVHTNTPLHDAVQQYTSTLHNSLDEAHSNLLSTYIQLSPELSTLSHHLNDITAILTSATKILSSFKVNLHSISEEIRHLQEKSSLIRSDLLDNKSLEKELILWIRECLIEGAEIKIIFEADINEKWMLALEKLERKYAALKGWETKMNSSFDTSPAPAGDISQSGDNFSENTSHLAESPRSSGSFSTTTSSSRYSKSRLFQQMRVQYSLLFKKTVSRIRTFLLEKILALTSSTKSNPEFLKINVLIKYRYLYHFLLMWEKNVAMEVKSTYIQIIQRYYIESFTVYIQTLLKLEKNRLQAPWIIRQNFEQSLSSGGSGDKGSSAHGGSSTTSASSWQLLSSSAYKLINRTFAADDTASLDVSRAQTLIKDSQHKPVDGLTTLGHPIVCHIAASQKESFSFEEIFKSVYILLSDTTTSEHIFDTEFFKDEALHSHIFSISVKYIDDYLVQPYLTESHNILSVLALIYFVDVLQRMMQEREVAVLDTHLEQLNMRLIVKFKELFDPNIAALREPLTRSEIDAELKDHILTKRFSRLSIGVHLFNSANKDSANHHMLESNLRQLRELYLKALNNQVISTIESSDVKRRCTFLIHAFDFILSQYIHFHIDCNDGIEFQKHLEEEVSAFVRYQIEDQFSSLCAFVSHFEAAINKKCSEEENRSRVDQAAMAKVAKQFQLEWQRGIEAIVFDVDRRFGDLPSLCADIRRQSMLHLLMMYSRFRNVVYACFTNPPFRSNLISPDRIMNAVDLDR